MWLSASLVVYQCAALVKSLLMPRENKNQGQWLYIVVTNWYWVRFCGVMSQWSAQCWKSGSSSTPPCQQGGRKSQRSHKWTLIIDVDKNTARPLRSFISNHSSQQEEEQQAQEGWRDRVVQHSHARQAFRETSEMHHFLFSVFLNLILPPIIYLPPNLIKSK